MTRSESTTAEAYERVLEALERALITCPNELTEVRGFFTHYAQHPTADKLREALALLPALKPVEQPEQPDDCREAFERVARERQWDIYGIGINGQYHSMTTYIAWESWQAAWKLKRESVNQQMFDFVRDLATRPALERDGVFLGWVDSAKKLLSQIEAGRDDA